MGERERGGGGGGGERGKGGGTGRKGTVRQWEQREREMARECDGRQWNL